MIKLLFLVVAIYVLYRLFANDFFKKRKQDDEREKAEIKKKVACGEMVKDPQCGVYVEKDSSISVKKGEQSWYFCSYECRDAFLKSLEKGGRNLPEAEEKGKTE